MPIYFATTQLDFARFGLNVIFLLFILIVDWNAAKEDVFSCDVNHQSMKLEPILGRRRMAELIVDLKGSICESECINRV